MSTPLTLAQSATAIGLGNTVSFLGIGGVPPYSYSTIVPGGQGGTIDPVSGVYSSPPWANYNSNPSNATDTVIVTDSTGATAQAKILVGPPLILFLDIISTVMKLPPGRCVLYDQKVFQTKQPGLFVSVGVGTVKTFANSFHFDPNDETYKNFVNSMVTLDVHIVSVDNSALFQKEAVLGALMSPYSIQQQNANAFSIGRIPSGANFNDLSEIDGPAIPYHFHIPINMQYVTTTQYSTGVYTEFLPVQIVEVNP